MRLRAVGWTISLGVLAAGLAMAAAGAARNAETRRKAADSARLLRDRSVSSATHLRDQATESAQLLRDQWSQAALEVRDRWSETAEDVRGRADEWREKSTENFERALRQAAEARDESLAGLPDEEDEDRSDDAATTDDAGSAEDAGEPSGDAGVLRDGPDPDVEPLTAPVADALDPEVVDEVEQAAATPADAPAEQPEREQPQDEEQPQEAAAAPAKPQRARSTRRRAQTGVVRGGPDPELEPLTTSVEDALDPDAVARAEAAAGAGEQDGDGR